ncbi:MAG: LysM peptidoglycan-binding domain-containing protein [Planctomycetes bacterium]|nr:LysM peptidoglycan-binding domain-containing protein [Planctomycetota bacterium]
MSTGFRIFLLILFAFGAVYAYRFRSREIHHWLRAEPDPDRRTRPRDPVVSPVDRVPDRDLTLATLTGQRPPPVRPAPEGQEPLEALWGAGPEEGSGEGLALDAADLPIVAEDRSTEAGEALEGGDPAGLAEPGEPGGAAPGPGEVQGADPAAIRAFHEIEHRVGEGESLWKISEALLGSGARYHEILEQNPEVFRTVDPDRLPVGTVLKIRVPVRQESLKPPAPRADTSVEGSPVPDPVDRGRKPPPRHGKPGEPAVRGPRR